MTLSGPVSVFGERGPERHHGDHRTFVRIAHPDIAGEAQCPLSALDTWRQKGWRPVEFEYQTPAEVVEQRVADLKREQELWAGDTP